MLYQLLDHADSVVFAFETQSQDRLCQARWWLQSGTEYALLGPCVECGHDAIAASDEPLVCWHCSGRNT